MDVGNLISGSSAFSKSSLNIWKFLVHVLLKPSLENFEHYFASLWDECICAVVWTFFGIALLWYWNENWPFPVLWPLLSFPDLLAYWMQHFNSTLTFNKNGLPFPSPMHESEKWTVDYYSSHKKEILLLQQHGRNWRILHLVKKSQRKTNTVCYHFYV